MKYWVFDWHYDIWNEVLGVGWHYDIWNDEVLGPDIITPVKHPVLHSRYHNASQTPSTTFQISQRHPNTQYFIPDIITPTKHPVLHSRYHNANQTPSTSFQIS
jgi:hypothetical protein